MRIDEVGVLQLAERQWGVITRGQLTRSGLSAASISRWLRGGRLQRIHPRVYAVGHRALSTEGVLAAALLYAGPGAALSHASAAHWWGILPSLPRTVYACSPARRRSVPGVRVHGGQHLERALHRHLPVTTVARTLLDLASTSSFDVLRRAVAEADYLRLLDLDTIDAVLGRGRPGSRALRKALDHHRPQYARTSSQLEDRLLDLCISHAIHMPEVNVEVAGFRVDALWRRQWVIAEVDGRRAHGTPARMDRDRRRDLALRVAGYLVVRYTWRQVTAEPELVAADLRAALTRGAIAGTPTGRPQTQAGADMN